MTTVINILLRLRNCCEVSLETLWWNARSNSNSSLAPLALEPTLVSSSMALRTWGVRYRKCSFSFFASASCLLSLSSYRCPFPTFRVVSSAYVSQVKCDENQAERSSKFKLSFLSNYLPRWEPYWAYLNSLVNGKLSCPLVWLYPKSVLYYIIYEMTSF